MINHGNASARDLEHLGVRRVFLRPPLTAFRVSHADRQVCDDRSQRDAGSVGRLCERLLTLD